VFFFAALSLVTTEFGQRTKRAAAEHRYRVRHPPVMRNCTFPVKFVHFKLFYCRRVRGLWGKTRAENTGAGGGNRTHGLGIMRPSLFH
jgi:hypothetical protein